MITPALNILQLVCIALVIAASLHDLVARTIPNGLTMLVAGIGLIVAAAGGHLLGAFLAAAIIFIMSTLCWLRGWLGGGDVKLLGAVALAVPPLLAFTFVLAVTIAGGLLAFVYVAARYLVRPRRSPRPASLLLRAVRVERWRISRGGPLPYACAIAAGAVFVFMQGSLS